MCWYHVAKFMMMMVAGLVYAAAIMFYLFVMLCLFLIAVMTYPFRKDHK